ncbi:MAG: hypothetical protein WDN45_12120 [Caulobacteraceae bacterium]
MTALGLLEAYKPKPNAYQDAFMSKRLYQTVMDSELQKQDGFRFLKSLRANYASRIIVQPFPSGLGACQGPSGLAYQSDLCRSPGRPIVLLGHQGPIPARACREAGADLLPYPVPSWRADLFAPAEIMQASDGIHGLEEYGAMVLRQLAAALKP